MACLEGPHGKVKSECRQRVQDLGHMTLLGSHDGVLCVSQDCVRLVDLNQKNRVLVGLMEVLSKRHTWEGAGRHGLLRKSYQELTFACDF